MKLFFYVKFEPITSQPGKFTSELIGFCSDPYMAMLHLHRYGTDHIGYNSKATGILYSSQATAPDLAHLCACVAEGRPAQYSGITAIAIENNQFCFFLNLEDQAAYNGQIIQFTHLIPSYMPPAVLADWQLAFSRNDGRLHRLMGNPIIKKRRPTPEGNPSKTGKKSNYPKHKL